MGEAVGEHVRYSARGDHGVGAEGGGVDGRIEDEETVSRPDLHVAIRQRSRIVHVVSWS